MASIVQTTTKINSFDPWLHNGKTNECFTDEIFSQNILPYWSFIESTTGFQNISFEINGDTRTYTIVYDTPNNANIAFSNIFGPSAVQECKNYRLATAAKVKELNVNYTFNTVINY